MVEATEETSTFILYGGIVWVNTPLAQQLDPKTIGRLEGAISKSQYVGAGKTLKVVNKVCVLLVRVVP